MLDHESPSYELQSKVPVAIPRLRVASTHSTYTSQGRGPDHVIIDMPESEETPTPPSTIKDNSDNANRESVVDSRERAQRG